ncbi:hypothetical protein OROHE_000624 [Orobanche hederae]
MMNQEVGADELWFNYLTDPMLVKIWDAGNKGTVKEYSRNGDMVRFFNAVCSHANEQIARRL